jgi:hypothetical protein
VGGEYEVERGGDPSYRDVQSEMMGLPHRSPSQRKRKAPKLLEEELSAEKHSKKLKKDHLVREGGIPGEIVQDGMMSGGEGTGCGCG